MWTPDSALAFFLSKLLARKDAQLIAFPNAADLVGVVPTLGTISDLSGQLGLETKHFGHGCFGAYDGPTEIYSFFGGGAMLKRADDESYTPMTVQGDRHRRLRLWRKMIAAVPGLAERVGVARKAPKFMTTELVVKHVAKP